MAVDKGEIMEGIAIQLLFIFLITLVGMLGIGAGIGLAICITNLLSSIGNLINSYIRKKKEAKMIKHDHCPVCGYKFEMCQRLKEFDWSKNESC